MINLINIWGGFRQQVTKFRVKHIFTVSIQVINLSQEPQHISQISTSEKSVACLFFHPPHSQPQKKTSFLMVFLLLCFKGLSNKHLDFLVFARWTWAFSPGHKPSITQEGKPSSIRATERRLTQQNNWELSKKLSSGIYPGCDPGGREVSRQEAALWGLASSPCVTPWVRFRIESESPQCEELAGSRAMTGAVWWSLLFLLFQVDVAVPPVQQIHLCMFACCLSFLNSSTGKLVTPCQTRPINWAAGALTPTTSPSGKFLLSLSLTAAHPELCFLLLLVLFAIFNQLIKIIHRPAALSSLSHLKPLLLHGHPSLSSLGVSSPQGTSYIWLKNVTQINFPVAGSHISSQMGFLTVRNDKGFCSVSHFTHEDLKDQN